MPNPRKPKTVASAASSGAMAMVMVDQQAHGASPVVDAVEPVSEIIEPAVDAQVEAVADMVAPTAEVAPALVEATQAVAEGEPLPEALAPVHETADAAVEAALAAPAKITEPAMQSAREAVDVVTETASSPKAGATPSPMPAAMMMKGLTMATVFDPAKAQAALGDLSERAKGALEKGMKLAEELGDLAKGNAEAMVASGRVAAKGVEEMAQYGAEYGRKTVEQATTAMKTMSGVKSPTELFQLQSEYAKSAVDALVSETSKFTESYLKLIGEIAQPLSTRYAVASEKIKAATTIGA